MPAFAFDEKAVLAGLAGRAADNATAVAARLAWDGLMLDYEPSGNYSASHVRMYATAIEAFAKAAHAKGLRLGVCIGNWGIVDAHEVPQGMKIYESAGADILMSMGATYHAYGDLSKAGTGDATFLKIFRLSQLMIEYLLNVQDILAEGLEQVSTSCKEAKRHRDKYREKTRVQDEKIKALRSQLKARRQTALRRLRSYHGPPIRWVRGVRDLAKPRAREAEAPLDFGLPFLVDGDATTGLALREELYCGRCRGLLEPGALLCGTCSGLTASSNKEDFPAGSIENAGCITDRPHATEPPAPVSYTHLTLPTKA